MLSDEFDEPFPPSSTIIGIPKPPSSTIGPHVEPEKYLSRSPKFHEG